MKHFIPWWPPSPDRVTVDTALGRAIDLAAAAERLNAQVADLAARVDAVCTTLEGHQQAIGELVAMLTDEADDWE